MHVIPELLLQLRCGPANIIRYRRLSLDVSAQAKKPRNLDSRATSIAAFSTRLRTSLSAKFRAEICEDHDKIFCFKHRSKMITAANSFSWEFEILADPFQCSFVIFMLRGRLRPEFSTSSGIASSTVLSTPAADVEWPEQLVSEVVEREWVQRVEKSLDVVIIVVEDGIVQAGLFSQAAYCFDQAHAPYVEEIMTPLESLLSNDPTLSSLPLLSTFLKSYSRPFLGIVPPAASKQISVLSEPGTLSSQAAESGAFPSLSKEEDELVEQEIRDRFKRMCEGYFENVCKKLIIEHTRLQEQDRRNHEAYIRSGEIFEDRQQAYEKMTKSYEKLLASCQSLSELLYLPLPTLPTNSQKSDSILIGANRSNNLAGDENDEIMTGGKWEDEEERRFFEDVQDLKDFVPRGVLGIDDTEGKETESDSDGEKEKERIEKEKEEVRKLEEELESLGEASEQSDRDEETQEILDQEDAPTPTPGTPRATTPPLSPHLAPQGPSQLLTALLVRLPDATNRALIDQAAIDFAFLNSKAARKRLVKFLGQVPKNRTDLLPHYARLVATLNKYMPDIGTDLVAILDEEFRYLQRKKNVVKELSEVRLKNIMYLSNLTKFRVVPSHLILHVFKVCLDDFSGTNVENLALLLEGCGRFLLRSEDTHQRFATMLELMRRKQSMQHFDQRQLLLLENAYYQCNPPERAPRQEKERAPIELFIRHLIYDVLAKKTIDKVLKLIRKMDWEQEDARRMLHKFFTKPWKIKFSNISLLAMLTYDLQRYHPEFAVAVVDQVLEDVRRGLEQNVYSTNQRRVATIKYLGELYIYRLLSSGIVFDTLWSLVTFGHPDARPLPNQPCPLDMPDDFFRIRLVCVLLDTCGMCFDRGTQKKKLDNFLVFFQYYVHCKDPLPMDVDFMLSDSLEAVRPKLEMPKTIEEAANAVDEMLNSAFQNADLPDDGTGSGDESGDEDDRPEEIEGDDDEDEETQSSPVDERAPSPDELVVLSSSNSHQDNLGPSEEAEAEFAKELAKMVTDSSAESRKVDKKTALALWDAAVLPPGARKKKPDEGDEELSTQTDNANVMNFTVITKRGNKQQAVSARTSPAIMSLKAIVKSTAQGADLRKRELENEAKSAVTAFVSEWKGKSLDAIVEQVRDGTTLRVRLLMPDGEHQVVNIALAGVRSARASSKQGEPSEQWGEEAKFFTESRLLQRPVRVQILSLPTSTATPFQSGASGTAAPPASIFIGTVLHPAGNVAEHLVAAGLARVVDWHAGMLASSGGMEKLRAAEKNAKEKRLCLYANVPATAASKSNGTTSNGHARVFDATVIRVWSGDQVSVVEKETGKERRLQLSSTRGPKLSDPKQAQYAQDAREFLRKKLIGKHVKVNIDFIRPREGDFEERECATIRYGGQNANIAEQLIEKGLAGLIRHKRDDEDRASDYDKLMAAEQAAVADTRGIHSGKELPAPKQPLNISESTARATQFLNSFKRMGRIPAIVDYVAAGSRFKLLLPKDNQTLTLVLGGIRAPRTARNTSEKGEPYGIEASEFASRRYMQRDVEFEVDTLDKSGGFIGSLYLNKTENAAVTLVKEGLATVHSFSADGLSWSRQLYDAEAEAKQAKRNIWSEYDEEAEKVEAPAEETNGPLKAEYIDVIVSDARFTPTYHSMNFADDHVGIAALEKLMRDFSLHHRSPSAAPPNFTPKGGDLVSAKFSDGSWYRAKIRRASAVKKEAEVTFIDYGNQDTVSFSNIRPLDQKFRSLPGQAHEARLSFVKLVGPESEYYPEAIERFRSLCEGRKLVANIDQKEGSLLHLRLMDPSDPAAAEDPLACINADLLHDGVAAIDRKGCRYLSAYPQVVKKLQSAVAQAKKERLGIHSPCPGYPSTQSLF
ncbi:Nonsense-mediated mRNA decay factor [Mycena sanguinolenta]|uniref:Nonsense-mediated mRNA decay factor n=1 Tax=Mycena sanguinolenta TaxID=230812 RepID=A0A8H6ZG21_9AGAR|nr:Nonsense-mediated mRNA decay factor [Mycena sanguinolenta]